ncbi:MAG: M50 family metallopeptidase [bacterium]
MSGLKLRYVSEAIDRIFNALKWPIAVVVFLLLPGSLVSVGKLCWAVGHNPQPVIYFLIGVAAYYLTWRFLLARPELGSYFSTLEHEVTHALFALATFHPVTAIKASWKGHGVMRYRGEGNWLITLSPYFFPTLSMALMLLFWAFPDSWQRAATLLLGVTLSYHVTSTYREAHTDQPDLKKVGLPFAITFLPTANLVCFGSVVAFAHGGGKGLTTFLGNISAFTAAAVRWMV